MVLAGAFLTCGRAMAAPTAAEAERFVASADALEALTGERQIDATPILDYFAPLKKWLDEQKQGQPIGW
jgi:hypothetical protein